LPGPGVTPTKHTIGELLHDRNPFEVPKYQRAYAWTEDELEDFEEDANRLLAARLARTPTSHFYGGLVSVLKTGQTNARGHTYEVVDGQQRLATFIILLRLVHDELGRLAERATTKNDATVERQAKSLAEEMLKEYVQYSERMPDGTRELRYRLKLSLADEAFFSGLLNGASPEPSRDSHRRLATAYRQLRQNLLTEPLAQSAALGDEYAYLEALASVLLEDAYVIHIVAEDTDEAYQLFAVLNDRGRMLTDADLLRSLTLQLSEPDPPTQTNVADAWDLILSQDMADADHFLRAYYPSQTGQRAPKVKMWHEFRDRWLSSVSPAQVLDHVRDLEKHVGPYRSLAAGEWPFPNPSAGIWDRDRLKRLVVSLKHDLAHPLLLAAVFHLSEPDFSKLVHLLERFAFRYKNIGGGHAGAASREYYDAATELRAGTFTLVGLQGKLSGLVARSVPDPVFRTALTTKLVYSTAAQRRNIKYFLTTLDDYVPSLRRGSNPPSPDRSRLVDLTLVDIEHIYPQTPQAGHHDAQLEPITHTVQNLTFWAGSDNRAALNAPFTAKVPLYQQSAGHLNRELAALPAWNTKEADNRLASLLDDACEVFRI
jgi:hypothetical protein